MPYLYSGTKRVKTARGEFTPDGWPECMVVSWSYDEDDWLSIQYVLLRKKSVIDLLTSEDIEKIREDLVERVIWAEED